MRTLDGWVAGLALTVLGAGCGNVTAKPDAGGGDADSAIDAPNGAASLAVMPLTQEFRPVALAASSAPVTFRVRIFSSCANLIDSEWLAASTLSGSIGCG